MRIFIEALVVTIIFTGSSYLFSLNIITINYKPILIFFIASLVIAFIIEKIEKIILNKYISKVNKNHDK